MAESPLPFVRLTYVANRTPTGRRTATPARRAARYFAFGHDREAAPDAEQRGRWVGPGGQTHDHEAVLAGLQRRREARLHLSGAALGARRPAAGGGFSRAMQEGRLSTTGGY